MFAFDNNDFEAYRAEAKQRWGGTAAYAEYEKKNRDGFQEKIRAAGMESVMGEFALCLKSGADPDSAEAQALVRKLQDYITENFYTCTNPILAGLGQMYVTDERFKSNIDKHGCGTAEFISKAVEVYCSKIT